MISVILYGRNDAHGYNLHRRAALSLNCIAAVLTDPADEIVFVDYNTPDELPTFVEALSDTLTDRCLGLLRVIRVPAALHERRFGDRTHLAVVEPVARNVAARRSNPSNRWLLSTNTDMILLPLSGESLSQIVGQLPDGFYGLPRFELPEWVWERLPRSDPRRALAELEQLGPRLRLDEPTVSHEWIRFDAPGDFQLFLREDLFAIDGFDEEMLLGWHVDSNLSRRLYLHRGSIESAGDHVAGYHCNHSRTPTAYDVIYQVANDLERYFFSVDEPRLESQRATWGLADVALDEVLVRQPAGALVETVSGTIPPRTGVPTSSDSRDAAFELSYDSGHVLPFVVDSLVVSSRYAAIGYMGANRALERMLVATVGRLGFEQPLAVADLEDPRSVADVARTADVFVVDLGVDASSFPPGPTRASLPASLDRAFSALECLIEVERDRLGRGEWPRRIVLVNSATLFWDAYVRAQLDCSLTTTHSRVRRATVKPSPDHDGLAFDPLARARRLGRWAARTTGDGAGLRVGLDEAAEFSDLEDYRGFGEGWAFPEEEGVWTEGPRAELALSLESGKRDCVLVLSIANVCVAPEGSLHVELRIDGAEPVARTITRDDIGTPWRVELPGRALARGKADLSIAIATPSSPRSLGWSSDDRALGICLGEVALEPADRRVPLGTKVNFTVRSDSPTWLLAEGWSVLEPTGVWTVGERARLILQLTDTPGSDLDLLLDLRPFVTADHPALNVEVSARGQPLVERVFRHRPSDRILRHFRRGESYRTLRVRLPEAAFDDLGRTVVDFRVVEPARPVDLGLSRDPRRLGLHLRSLEVRRRDRRRHMPHDSRDGV